jgi:TIR domain
MRVFISWSGEPSRSVAVALHGWLPVMLKAVDPWMSAEDIRGGSRWFDVLAEALDDIDFGIVCVTRSNRRAPWLLFESGALAKRVGLARLVPLCIDFPVDKLTGPLGSFQGHRLDRDGVWRLVRDLYEVMREQYGRRAVMGINDLWELFHVRWPNLEEAIEGALRTTEEPNA